MQPLEPVLGHRIVHFEVHKVKSLTIQEHVDVPAGDASQKHLPHEAEAELVPLSEAVHLIEPKAGEEVGEGCVGSEDNAGVREIWKEEKEMKWYEELLQNRQQ